MPNLSPPPKTGNVEFDRWFFLLYKSLSDAGAVTPAVDTSLRPVPYGGTGASSLSGYLRGNGSNPFTAVTQIPASDISGLVQSRAYGPQVDALDQIGGTGIYALTALGAATVRTMTGTAGRLSITNGDGVAGNPTFDISTSYVGQATITTLGTITTGAWNGSIIATAYTQAQVVFISGVASRTTVTGTATVPIVDISASYAGQNTIVTLGTVTAGVWNAGAVTSSGPVSATQSILTNGANNSVTNHIPLKRDTTDATVTELTTDSAVGSGATNRLAVPTNTALSVVVNICAKVSGSANSKQMLRQFLIVNTAGTTSIQGAVAILGADISSAALATASTTITANDADDCIKIEVTGVAATNIRWTAQVVSTAVMYA